jgi:hypothetical protein
MANSEAIRDYKADQYPFVRAYVVRGKVCNPEYSVENVRTEIRYLEVGEGPILGAFYGDPDLWEKVVRALSHSNSRFQGTWSSPNGSYEIRFELKNIIFGSVNNSFETDRICQFECLNLEMERRYHPQVLDDDKPRELVISYVIPYRSELFVPPLPSFLRSEVPDYEDHIELDSIMGKIVITTDQHAPRSAPDGLSLSILVAEQSIKLRLQSDNVHSHEGLEQTEQMIKTALLVISLFCKQRTDYYKRTVEYVNKQGREVRGTTVMRSRSTTKKGFTPILFSKQEMSIYLKKVFSGLLLHLDRDSIEEAAVLHLSAIDSQHAEEKLILRQAGIEVIVNTYWKRLGLHSTTCLTCGLHTDKLRDRLLETVHRLDVDISDIYPSVLSNAGKTFPFIGFRNKILHGQRDKIKDIRHFLDELTRQEFLLHRLILHSIGVNVKAISVLNQAGFWLKPY